MFCHGDPVTEALVHLTPFIPNATPQLVALAHKLLCAVCGRC